MVLSQTEIKVIAKSWTELTDSPDWVEIGESILKLLTENQQLRKQIGILEIKNAGTLANNLCPDHRDKQLGKPCLACTIETADTKQTTQMEKILDVIDEMEAYVFSWENQGVGIFAHQLQKAINGGV